MDGFLRETDLAIEAKAKKMVTAVLGEVNEKPGTSIHIQRQSNLAIETEASLDRRVRKTTNPENVNSLTLRGLVEFVLQFPIFGVSALAADVHTNTLQFHLIRRPF